jgi:hypothetical protein
MLKTQNYLSHGVESHISCEFLCRLLSWITTWTLKVEVRIMNIYVVKIFDLIIVPIFGF